MPKGDHKRARKLTLIHGAGCAVPFSVSSVCARSASNLVQKRISDYGCRSTFGPDELASGWVRDISDWGRAPRLTNEIYQNSRNSLAAPCGRTGYMLVS